MRECLLRYFSADETSHEESTQDVTHVKAHSANESWIDLYLCLNFCTVFQLGQRKSCIV